MNLELRHVIRFLLLEHPGYDQIFLMDLRLTSRDTIRRVSMLGIALFMATKTYSAHQLNNARDSRNQCGSHPWLGMASVRVSPFSRGLELCPKLTNLFDTKTKTDTA